MMERLAREGCYQNASEVLRDAASIGIADIEAGRFRSFRTKSVLRDHLGKRAKATLEKRER